MNKEELQIDHLVWATADVATDVDMFHAALGVPPVAGGRHAGLGTANHLLDLGTGTAGAPCYLELIHPDAAADGASGLSQTLGALAQPGLYHWAVRAGDLDAIDARARGAGLGSTGAIDLERARPDGVMLRWRLLFLTEHPFGGLLPFFIDWMDAEHPALSLASGVEFRSFRIGTPDPSRLAATIDALGVEADVRACETPSLSAELEGPAGTLELTTGAPFRRGLSPF